MKRYVLFAIILGSSVVMTAQPPEIEWGPFTEIPENTTLIRTFGFDGEEFFGIRAKTDKDDDRTTLWLEYYYENEVQISKEFLMPTVDGISTRFKELFYINRELILITVAHDTKNNKKYAYIQLLNDNGTLKTTPEKIGEIDLVGKAIDEPTHEEAFHFMLSDDGQQIIVYYHDYFEEYTDEPVHFKVISDSLEFINEHDIILPLKERKFSITQAVIGKSGNIYIAAKIEQESGRRSSRSSSKQYEKAIFIKKFDIKKDTIYKIPIDLGRQVAADIVFKLDKEERIHVCGFIKDKRSPELKAVYHMEIDPVIPKILTNVNSRDFYRKFSRDELEVFECKRLSKMTEEHRFNYVPQDILFIENGCIIFISENQYVDTLKRGELEYHHNDLYLTMIMDKEIKWAKWFPKAQTSYNDGGMYSSYRLAIDGVKLRFMYNGDPSNIDEHKVSSIKTIKDIERATGMVLTVFSVDGAPHKMELFENEGLLKPALIKEHRGIYLMYQKAGNEYRFGTFFF